MNILVTGAGGFVGRHLCRRLRTEGHTVHSPTSAECDLRRTGALDRFNTYRLDRIYHLATWTKAGGFSRIHPGEQWLINQALNTNVLEWWQGHQAQALMITPGSICACDPNDVLTEANYMRGTPIDSVFTYGMTKRMLYSGLLALHSQYKLDYLYPVLPTVYGTDYPIDGRPMHFIFDLVRKILAGVQDDEPVVLWGDGHQRRELIYVDDVVAALIRLPDRCRNDIVNLGMGDDFSIREFADMICSDTGYDPDRIEYDPDGHVGARTTYLDITKWQRLDPDTPRTPLAEGLTKTITWFRTHWDQIQTCYYDAQP